GRINMGRLPAPREALEILHKVGCTPPVIDHCKAVSQLAVMFAKRARAKGINIDIDLVRIGGLLHDIGRSKTNSVDHGFIGGVIASSLGLPESVRRIIERHVGSGIPSDEAVKLGLPQQDFVPETLEEKIVSYADKLIEGKHRKSFDAILDRFAKELGPTHPAIARLRKLHAELARIIEEPL
ncbi:MAG: TIGR00295 family protein, partial [Candidatus Bathyarchaeia archaeon]